MAGPYPRIGGLRELAEERGFNLLRSWRKGLYCLVDRSTGNYARAPNALTAFTPAQAVAFLEARPIAVTSPVVAARPRRARRTSGG